MSALVLGLCSCIRLWQCNQTLAQAAVTLQQHLACHLKLCYTELPGITKCTPPGAQAVLQASQQAGQTLI